MIQVIPSGAANCYLLRPNCGGPAILVDAGTAADQTFLAKLSACLPPQDLALVILTHGHYDHVGHAARLQGEYGVPVAVHPGDREMVTRGSLTCPLGRGLLGGFIRRVTLRTVEKSRYIPFLPDRLLAPGPLPGFPGVEIVALPGHTPGSIGVVFEGCLLAGDAVMNLPLPALPWLAEDFPAARKSLTALAGRSFVKIYPGHGRPIHGAWLDRKR